MSKGSIILQNKLKNNFNNYARLKKNIIEIIPIKIIFFSWISNKCFIYCFNITL